MALTDSQLSRGNAETLYALNPLYTINVDALWILNMPTRLSLLERRESPMPLEVISRACFMKTSQTTG